MDILSYSNTTLKYFHFLILLRNNFFSQPRVVPPVYLTVIFRQRAQGQSGQFVDITVMQGTRKRSGFLSLRAKPLPNGLKIFMHSVQVSGTIVHVHVNGTTEELKPQI